MPAFWQSGCSSQTNARRWCAGGVGWREALPLGVLPLGRWARRASVARQHVHQRVTLFVQNRVAGRGKDSG